MKKVIAFFVIIMAVPVVKAQESTGKKIVLSIGIEAGLPAGTSGIGNLYSFAIGGSLEGEYLVSPSLGITLKAGYLDYLVKGGGNSDGFIPLLAGLKYHFTHQVYFAGMAGIAFSTLSRGTSSFSFAPGLGFVLSEHAEVLLRYEALYNSGLTIGNFGVRVAYDF